MLYINNQSITFTFTFIYIKVTRSVNMGDAELSPQEEKTINSIVNARFFPCLYDLFKKIGVLSLSLSSIFHKRITLHW